MSTLNQVIMKNKIIRGILDYFRKIKFRNQLLITYVLIVIIPVVFISVAYYRSSYNTISDITKNNVYEIVRKDNEINDALLSKIAENSMSIAVDPDLYNSFYHFTFLKNTNVLEMDRQVSRILIKYFSQSPEIVSAQIATNFYVFGSHDDKMSGNNFSESTLKEKAVSADGRLVWLPSYYSEFFIDYDITESNVMSAIRSLNISYVDNWIMHSLDLKTEKPVLIVNIDKSIYERTADSILLDNFEHYIINPEGSIVYHNISDRIGDVEQAIWIEEVLAEKSGTIVEHIGNVKSIICFDTSIITGWTSVVIVPANDLMREVMLTIGTSIGFITLIMLLIAFFFSLIFSYGITRPINSLLKTINLNSKGIFDSRIKQSNISEFDYLIDRFNKMNDSIEILIEENYLTKIREKENEIMALNLQFNPHFINNSLNALYWLALESRNDEIGDITMKLSKMLEYSVRDKSPVSSFKDDIFWLKCYIDIMLVRYDFKFTVQYDIQDKIHSCLVPKFFLQPIIENAIFHGISELTKKGKIEIKAWTENDLAVFNVLDNGKGIESDKLNSILKEDSSHIGLYNVHKRIQLIFGSEYNVEIKSQKSIYTSVTIKIPLKLTNNT